MAVALSGCTDNDAFASAPMRPASGARAAVEGAPFEGLGWLGNGSTPERGPEFMGESAADDDDPWGEGGACGDAGARPRGLRPSLVAREGAPT